MNQSKALAILKSGQNVFLTGSAGAGKTYVLNQYIKYLKDRKIKVATTASTGIAATHMNGQTIHSWSGMGIKSFMTPQEIRRLKEKKYLKEHIEDCDVLIIDEISMLHKNQLNLVNEILMTIRDDYNAFGGMQVVFAGDFFQLPPISKNDEPSNQCFAFMSRAWLDANLKICYITEQHRQNDNIYNNILNEIRSKTLSKDSLNRLEASGLNTPKMKPTKLFTHNVDVDRINHEHLMELSSDEFEFVAITKGNPNLIEGLRKSVLAPAQLKLKIKAKVMFVRNNYDAGYMNGTLGTVIDFEEDEEGETFPIVKTFDGKRIAVEMETWSIENEKGQSIASLEQYPLRLAWAITVHKSQGMTLDAAEVDLSKTFEMGQGYVALSRLKSIDGLKLLGANEYAFEVDNLAFKADVRFQELSEEADVKYSIEDLEKGHLPFLKACDGLTDEEQIEKYARKKEAKRKKMNTYEQTRALINAGMTIEQIIDERDLSQGTVMTHFNKIKNTHPETNFEPYRPEEELITAVNAAYKILIKDPENLYGDNELKISALYDHFKGKYVYHELKLALVFLD